MLAAERIYKIPDVGFTSIAMPQLIRMISLMKRPFFILSCMGLKPADFSQKFESLGKRINPLVNFITNFNK